MRRVVFMAVVLWAALESAAVEGVVEKYARIIAPLVDARKLATLKPRAANPRVQKVVYWLAKSRGDKADGGEVMEAALALDGVTNRLVVDLTKAAMLRNLTNATQLGCLDAAGMADMRRGQSPTIRLGEFAGDELSVDHIIPKAIAPELVKVMANLELIPLKANDRKGAKIGERQRALAGDLHKAGLLSHEGLRAVMVHL